MAEPPSSRRLPSLSTALWVWIKIGLLSFGGPTGQIALMHRELVEKRRWISDHRFLHALNFCMLLPGPEAQQLAIYTGWLLHRTPGAIIAGLCFVLPGALLMGIISYCYLQFGHVPAIQAVFYGLKPAVLAIIAHALIRIGRRILRNPVLWLISALAFTAIFFFNLPFPLVILLTLGFGIFASRWHPEWLRIRDGHSKTKSDEIVEECLINDTNTPSSYPPPSKGFRTFLLWTLVWIAPLLLTLCILGEDNILTEQAAFFGKAALVTFGGAYAVLPYVAQQAVEVHGWLTATQMVDGLGLAETTPGPLILVLQFVGFVGGWQNPETFSPSTTAVLAAVITTWMTFAPGFLFILVGAPYVEATRGHLRLTAALSAITAAVVGIIFNLAVWFGWHVIFPEPNHFDYILLSLSLFLFFLLLKWKIDVTWIVLIGAVCGLILHR